MLYAVKDARLVMQKKIFFTFSIRWVAPACRPGAEVLSIHVFEYIFEVHV